MDINHITSLCLLMELLAALVITGNDLCSLDTGLNMITDGRGYPHNVYISAKRDGTIWMRVGQDHKAQDWVYQNERKHRLLVTILEEKEVDMLEYMDYSDECVLTDLKFNIHADAAWHPSYVLAFDPETRSPVTMVFRMNPDERQRCRTNTTLSLTPNGQGLTCTGSSVNSCGYREIVAKNQRSEALFIKYLQLYPDGSGDSWACSNLTSRSSYTLNGSYYHGYVKLATCEVPTDSRQFGHEAKLRPYRDTGSNMIIIPDPQQTALADGVITAWRLFAKIISPDHYVFLQVWRPLGGSTTSFSLVGETYFQPDELRFQEINLTPDQYIQIHKGDVLGFYSPEQNPLAWSLVPCVFPAQRTLALNKPSAAYAHTNVHFEQYIMTEPGGNLFACRHYSIMAVLGNKSTAKRLEDWTCPTAMTPDVSLLWQRLDQWVHSNGSTDRRNTVIFNRNGHVTNTAFVNPVESLSSRSRYLILAVIGGLLLLFIIIGVVSFYQASRV